MASLLKRNGYYYAQFYDKRRSPQRKRLALGTTRKKIARRKLVQWETDYEDGVFDPWTDDPDTYDQTPQTPLTLQAATERFLKQKRQAGRTPNTIRSYRAIIRLLGHDVGADTPLEQLRPAQLKAFIYASDIAQATKRKRYGHLRAFLAWCVEYHHLRSSPIEEVPQPADAQKLPKAITADQLTELCDALRADYADKRAANSIREGQMIWRIPLFWFAFYTGMRGAELARLRWRHIDRERRLIYIYTQKNGREQTIPLNRRAAAVLDDVRPASGATDPDDYVFQSPSFEGTERNARWFRENASTAFREARRSADLPDALSFHSLRHGFCTALAEAGKSAVVIKEAARHADIQTSMRYVHMANEALKRELDDVFDEDV